MKNKHCWIAFSASRLLSALIPLLLYLLVGAGATLVEWIIFFLVHRIFLLHYQVATVSAIVVSSFSNWAFGRLTLFKKAERQGIISEIGKIYLVSLIGLMLNLLLMWFFVGKNNLDGMLSKMIATGIVFTYNYLIRRHYIYKGNGTS